MDCMSTTESRGAAVFDRMVVAGYAVAAIAIIAALVFALPLQAMLAVVAAGSAIAAGYALRLCLPRWRPVRTTALTALFAWFALVPLPCCITAVRPVVGFLFALAVIAAWFVFWSMREAFSASDMGWRSPRMFAHMTTVSALLLLGGLLARAFFTRASLLSWINLAPSDDLAARVYGHLPDFIMAGVFSVPLAMALNRGDRWRWTWCGAASLLVVGVALSYGRASMAMVATEFIALAWLTRHQPGRRRLMLVLLSVGVTTIVLVPGVIARILSLANLGQGTAGYRLQQWQAVMGLIARSPVLGYGLGSFSVVAAEAGLPADVCPHNFYLHVAVECGLPALFIFLGGTWHAMGRVFRSFEPTMIGDGNYRNALRMAALALVAGLLVFAMFDT